MKERQDPQSPDKLPARPSPANIPFEVPVPPPAPDSLPDIRSLLSVGRQGYGTEGGVCYSPQNPRDRTGADAVWFPGQNTDPAHF